MGTSDSEGAEHTIGVFVVDDHEMVAESLEIALSTVADLRPVGRAGTVAEAVAALAEITPDVVLVDQRLPDGNGVELAARLVAAIPGIGVVIITGYPDPSSLAAALEAGCRGYLTKGARFDSLVSTIRRVAMGEVAIPASMLQDLARHLDRRRSRPGEELTAREREVLVLLGRGASTEEISRSLALSSHTVRTHVRSILHKLNAHSRLQAVSTARALDLIDRT